MKRDPNSHKGDNGKVMIVGGSPIFHGAPILCSLGAEYSGVDLVFPYMPSKHEQVARTHSLNFIIHTFEKDHLSEKDVKPILELSEKMDVVVIGPGLGDDKETISAIKSLLSKLEKPTVIDASALIYTNSLPEQSILTPHRGEFKKLTGDEPTPENVQKWAENLKATILCKGPKDIIASVDHLIISDTGNSLMTVGGTGDVLSGLIGGLLAQKDDPIEACHRGVTVLSQAANQLAHRQDSLRAVELAEMLPSLLHKNT